jgi:hypothetical protein
LVSDTYERNRARRRTSFAAVSAGVLQHVCAIRSLEALSSWRLLHAVERG